MRSIVFLGSVAFGVALYGATPVGRSLSEIAVPLGHVEVAPESVTVSEAQVARVTFVKIATRHDLVSTVRNLKTISERLAVFEEICDHDDIFTLFFKPGNDRNGEIRKMALERMAEIEIVKSLGVRVPYPELKEAARARLQSIYRDERDFLPHKNDGVIRSYVKRTRPQSLK